MTRQAPEDSYYMLSCLVGFVNHHDTAMRDSP